MAGDVATLADPLHVERWASAFLGELWVRRDRVGYDDGWGAILGSPIVEDLAGAGGTGAKLALIALSRLDPTVFGVICGDLADELSGVTVPEWTDQIGAAKVTRAVWDLPPGCGELIILGLQRNRAESHSLLLCAADDPGDPIRYLAVCKPFDRVLEHFTPAPCETPFVRLKPAEPAFICRRIEKTMRASDQAPAGDLGEGYLESRALVLAAVREVVRPRITRNGFSLDGSQIARAGGTVRTMPVTSAEDLYGLPLDEFTPERNELAKRLRSEGEKEEAARVAKLRKPSTAAWAVNQLVRTQKKAIGELFETGDEMIDAQSQAMGGKGSAEALKAATRKQREVTTKLLEAAAGLLSSDGHELPASVQERVSETLRAAAVDPESREQVSDGCLVRELRFTGLAGFAADAQTSARAERAQEKRERETALRAAKDEQSEAERELKHAQRQLEAAERELTQAERARGKAAKAVEAAEETLEEARERTEQLQRRAR